MEVITRDMGTVMANQHPWWDGHARDRWATTARTTFWDDSVWPTPLGRPASPYRHSFSLDRPVLWFMSQPPLLMLLQSTPLALLQMRELSPGQGHLAGGAHGKSGCKPGLLTSVDSNLPHSWTLAFCLAGTDGKHGGARTER